MPVLLHGAPYDYFVAAGRKLEIVDYHWQLLSMILERSTSFGNDLMPPVDVQAHFEGVLSSAISAGDKIADGIRLSGAIPCPVAHDPIQTLGQSQYAQDPIVRDLTSWHDMPVVLHGRYLRNQAIHNHYDKSVGRSEYRVVSMNDPNEPPYSGDRELGAYTSALASAAAGLRSILERSMKQFQ